VRQAGVAAMLKVATDREEANGGATMAWWAGEGAAPVLARADGALLLERAQGRRSLAEMARTGCDADATAILCAAAAELHRPRGRPLPELVPLPVWFRALDPAASAEGGVFVRCAAVARRLLAEPGEPVVLHGDLHHDNVLDFGPRGWLAIDPKGLWGERGFDYGNIFTNPDLADLTRPVAVRPEIFARRLEIVADRARLERTRLLDWIIAWTGLSAAWFLEDGDSPATDLAIAALAIAARDA
jgi:streptomycin 6-kinase